MRTLADMTPEERASCGGMWAETSDGLAIIIEPFCTDKDRALDTTVVFSLKPKVGILQRIAAYVTPRFDLPRAWNPDGQPVPGEWEHGTRPHKVHISPHNITLDGIPLLHSDEAITIETLETDLHRVRLTVYADYIQLDEDSRPGHNTPGLSWEWETV